MKISTRARSSPTTTFTYGSRCNSTIPELPATELRSQHHATPSRLFPLFSNPAGSSGNDRTPIAKIPLPIHTPNHATANARAKLSPPGTHGRTLRDRDLATTQSSSSVHHDPVSAFVGSPGVPMRYVLLSSRRPVSSFSVNNSRYINLPSPLLRYRPHFP